MSDICIMVNRHEITKLVIIVTNHLTLLYPDSGWPIKPSKSSPTTLFKHTLYVTYFYFVLTHVFHFWFVSECIFFHFCLLYFSPLYTFGKMKHTDYKLHYAFSSPFQVSHGYLLGAASFERGVQMDGLRFIKRFSSVYFNLAALKPLRLNATRWLPRGTWRFPDTVWWHQCASHKTYRAFQRLLRSAGQAAVFVRVLFLTRKGAMLIFLLLHLIKTEIKSELLGKLDPKGWTNMNFHRTVGVGGELERSLGPIFWKML